jgi:hypothetical protein
MINKPPCQPSSCMLGVLVCAKHASSPLGVSTIVDCGLDYLVAYVPHDSPLKKQDGFFTVLIKSQMYKICCYHPKLVAEEVFETSGPSL